MASIQSQKLVDENIDNVGGVYLDCVDSKSDVVCGHVDRTRFNRQRQVYWEKECGHCKNVVRKII